MSGTNYIASNWRVPENSNSSKNDNYSLSFDGNEYINCGVINQVQTFSVSMWVNPLNWSARRVALQMGASSNYGLSFWFMSDGTLRCVGANVTNDSYFGSIVANADTYLPSGSWGHILFTHEQTGTGATQKIYINGTLRNTYTSTTNPYTINYLGNPLYIARRNNDIDRWLGNIGEVAIFDYALSDPQIESLAGRPETGAGNPMVLKPTPVGYWSLGDNSAGGIDPIGPTSILTQPNVSVDDASVFDFNASSSQKITLSNCTTHSADISVSFWMKAPAQGLTNIFGGSGIFQYFGSLNTGGALYIYDTGGSPAWKPVVGGAFDDTWHHIVVTRDSRTNTIKGYKDSVLDTTTVFSNAFLNNIICTIGSYSTTRFYEGLLSQVSLYNSTIEQAEVNEIYNSGVPGDISSLNPLAWYKLDQSSNWEADTSRNWQIPDAVSAYPQSFDFNGSSDYINTSLNIGTYTSFTVSAWVNATALAAGDCVFSQWLHGNTANSSWIVYTEGANKLKFYVGDGGAAVAAGGNTALTLGQWYHICATWNGTTNILYIDGVAESTTGSASSMNTTAVDMLIGAYNSGGGASIQNYFDGDMSNVVVWDTALDNTQIETLYNNGIPLTTAIQSANLKGWWKLDDSATFSTNWTVPDASGNGNDGTSSGMTEQSLVNNNVSALNGESSGMTSGNLVLSDLTRNLPYENYSMYFDAAGSNYVSMGNVLDKDGTEAFSISTWIKDTTAGTRVIVSKLDGSGVGFLLHAGVFSGQKIIWYPCIASGGNIQVRNSSAINDGNWHHILATYDGSGNASGAKLYIDGSLDTNIITDTFTGTSSSTGPLQISAYNGTSFPFYGNISNTSIFNVELTPTEVLKVYANGLPQDLTNFTPQPVSWWTLSKESFWNGSDWIVRDMIGSNDGTSVNMGVDSLVGDAPRSEANGTGTNMDIPTNLVGNAGFSDKNAYSINMGPEARVTDTP